MKSGKILIYFLVTILIVFSFFYIEINSEKKTVHNESNNKELTLKEAIYLGLNRAKTWNKNASLTRITSVDENLEGSKGETGKRYNWNMEFSASNQKLLSIGISQGKISFSREHVGDNNGTIKLEDIKFDSPYLLNIAKKKYGLQKGLDWATGYQYTLDLIEGKPSITILGTDRNKLFTRISFDPKNAEVTDAMHKVPHGGGLYTISLNSSSPKLFLNEKGRAIKGISTNNKNLVKWGDRKPRVFNFAVQPFVELSGNSGKTWDKLDFNQNILNAWINSNNELYVATESEILRLNSSGNKKKRILTLKTKIEKMDYSQNNNIAVLSDNYIYTTNDDGENWKKNSVPKSLSIISLQISDKGTLILLTNDWKVILKNHDKWIHLNLPHKLGAPSNLRLIGDDYLVVQSEQSIWIHNLKDYSWHKLEINDQISILIKKRNNLFGISENGTIYLINLGGDNNEWITKSIYKFKKGIITDLDFTHNNLFIATVPDFYWENMN
ncbi:hypothetical protein ACFVR2_22870 [Gottfriedia sp. NPDC057991]|uniref:hypothetical protein n=1 Tax=Gottfriedia sp. NPDC057991 TaxID=3346298 RepID=UPI0036D930A0